MDRVINMYLAPENRSILFSPISQYSAVRTCANHVGNGMAIQNFATTATANSTAIKELEKLKKEGDLADECDDSAKGFE